MMFLLSPADTGPRVRLKNWPAFASSENLLANPTGVSISMDWNFAQLKLLVLQLLGFGGPR